MSTNKVSPEDLERTSKQWKEKIADLRTKVDDAEGSRKRDLDQLLQRLEQQQANVEQVLRRLKSPDRSTGERTETDVDRMFKDIDDTFREAMAYFY